MDKIYAKNLFFEILKNVVAVVVVFVLFLFLFFVFFILFMNTRRVT